MSAPRQTSVRSRAEAPEDDALLQRVAAGDMSALAAVYDRHAEPLLRFATRLCGRRDAEDLLHDTFVKARDLAARYDNRSPNARAWLFGIMAMLARDRRRALTRFVRALDRHVTGNHRVEHPRPDDRIGIEAALAKVSPSKRIVLLLAEVEGYTCEQIADMLRVPVGTVWTRLHHGRRALRAIYEGASE